MTKSLEKIKAYMERLDTALALAASKRGLKLPKLVSIFEILSTARQEDETNIRQKLEKMTIEEIVKRREKSFFQREWKELISTFFKDLLLILLAIFAYDWIGRNYERISHNLNIKISINNAQEDLQDFLIFLSTVIIFCVFLSILGLYGQYTRKKIEDRVIDEMLNKNKEM